MWAPRSPRPSPPDRRRISPFRRYQRMNAARLEAPVSRPDTPDRRERGTSRWSRTGKRVVDLVVGSILLVATAPLIGVAMLLTRLTSRGPALFSQVRVGINGGVFTMYKVRTMVHD